MVGADGLSTVLCQALRSETEGDSELCTEWATGMRNAYEAIGALVHAFYNTNFGRNIFLSEAPDNEMRAGVTSMLAGDVWRSDNRFQNALMSGRRKWSFESATAPAIAPDGRA